MDNFELSEPLKIGNYIRQDFILNNVGIGHISYKIEKKTLIIDMIRIDVLGLRNKGFAGRSLAYIVDKYRIKTIIPSQDGYSTQGKEFIDSFVIGRK
jgi:hypothetical protein